MKKLISILLILVVMATALTGCVKFKETLKLDEEGNLSISILSAFLVEETESGEPFTAETDYSELEEIEGCTVEKYSDDEGYSGSIITIVGNVNDSDENDEEGLIPSELGAVEMTVSDSFVLEGDKVIMTFASAAGDDLGGMEGYEDMIDGSGMVMELTVDFPFAAIETNATEVSEDSKVLTWDLLKAESIYAIYSKEDFMKYMGENAPVVENPFEDVTFGSYYHNSVLWAYLNGITTGTTKTTFSPDSTCTRGQVVTFLWRAVGEPEPETKENPFTDISENDYYYKPILWAVENGITNGTTATTFSPANTCTNAHILTFIYRTLGEPEKTGDGEWYEDAVKWAESYGVTKDTYEEAFDSSLPCPRKDVVTFLNRALKLYIPVSEGIDPEGEELLPDEADALLDGSDYEIIPAEED